MTDSQQLLAEYVRTDSEAAFRELVTRHVNLVYSAALRLVEGDRHRAEDVSQAVFVDLARLAGTLSPEIRLAGWLHRHTCFVATKTMRGERRRQSRERLAAEMNGLQNTSGADISWLAPILDEAINELNERDRQAILLRFFEQHDFRAVGESLGSNEDAARMRVNRALEKLQSLLKQRGVSTSAAALTVTLSAHAVQAAPTGLALTMSTAAAWATTSIAATAAVTKAIAMTTLQKSVLAALVVASLVTPVMVHYQARAEFREMDRRLRQQNEQLGQRAAEFQQLSNQLTQARSSRQLASEQTRELLRLRGEIARLRSDVQDLAPLKPKTPRSRTEMLASLVQRYSERASKLKQFLASHPSENVPEILLLTETNWLWLAGQEMPETEDGYRRMMSTVREMAESNVGRDILRPALRQYVQANNGQFPRELSQLASYLGSPLDDAILQRWQILQASRLINLRANLQKEDWVITQRAPVNRQLDQRFVFSVNNVYLFADAPPQHWDVSP